MWPVKPAMDMCSNRPAVQTRDKMSEIVPQEDDKNCQSIMLPKKSMCSDKNCHDTKFRWPVKTAMNMQSREPERKSSFKQKHVPLCQSTRYYRKQSNYKKCEYTKCLCNGKICQSANLM